MRQISLDHHTKDDGFKEELSVLQDNLDYQVQKKYQDICQEGYNTLCWYYHPEYTYNLDTPNSGSGNHITFWFGVYLYEWLWEYGNLEE